MSIEDQLKQIIELLTSIDSKLQQQATPHEKVKPMIPSKPTKGMLKFKRLIEFAAGMDRTQFLSGLGLTALRIGKIASERQMALLTLVYTSEQQYRIQDFAENLMKYADQINGLHLVEQYR